MEGEEGVILGAVWKVKKVLSWEQLVKRRGCYPGTSLYGEGVILGAVRKVNEKGFILNAACEVNEGGVILAPVCMEKRVLLSWAQFGR